MILEVAMAGRVPYERALVWQEALVARRQAGGVDALLLLEHPPVYTLGRGADAVHLGAAAGGTVPVHRVARGGEVTYHGPGQLVGYPIVGLADLRPDLHWYLRTLEQVLVRALADLGVSADAVPGRTGVWVEGRRKIASIGIAVRRWVTWHGFALNVDADLAGFGAITPCGIPGVEMTSIRHEGGAADIAVVVAAVRDQFVATLGYAGWRPLENAIEGTAWT
ncbi:MAG: lipoyl(octanoyl) transferase LipB [Candidatus Binatia bacterium]